LVSLKSTKDEIKVCIHKIIIIIIIIIIIYFIDV